MSLKKKIAPKIKWRDFLNLKRRLYTHVDMLATTIGTRNLQHYSALKKAQDYIAAQMTNYVSALSIQQFCADKKSVNNLILEKEGSVVPEEIIIIGAHYDTVVSSPGADDNASAIAGLLELIRLLHHYDNRRTLRFVAFTLEEPPFFGTELMGSEVYAKSCRDKNENVVAMVALEMLGYYSEKRRSQKYPLPDMKNHYSSRGNFIAVVGNESARQLTDDVTKHLENRDLIRIRKIVSPAYFHGIDLSDHSSFWKYDYPAIMLTDTAFYRNPHYHEVSDTIDKLNFRYFTQVVFSLAYALEMLDRQEMVG